MIITVFVFFFSFKESVHQLCCSLLKSLYPRALHIAKKITGLENETKAVESFRRLIQSPSMYFNEEPFPRNESDEKAHRKCSNEKGKILARRAILGTEPLACVAWRFLSKLSALRKRGSRDNKRQSREKPPLRARDPRGFAARFHQTEKPNRRAA